MAIYEVTIAGSAIMFDEDGGASCFEEESYIFVKEGRDLIETMMAVQAKLDSLNGALKAKYPKMYKDDIDWEYKVVGICKTNLIHFNDTWIKEFVEDGVVTRNYEEE